MIQKIVNPKQITSENTGDLHKTTWFWCLRTTKI